MDIKYNSPLLAAEASQMFLLILNPSGITNKQLGVTNECQCVLGFVFFCKQLLDCPF